VKSIMPTGLVVAHLLLGASTLCWAQAGTHEQFGLRFWQALSQADFPAMQDCYAPEVTLLAGSELLKKEWGVNPDGERGRNLVLKKEALLTGYKALVAKVGAEKWKGVFSKVGGDKISFVVAEKDGQAFAGVKKGDAVMKVATGPRDDALSFVLRPNDKGAWSVVMEATDY